MDYIHRIFIVLFVLLSACEKSNVSTDIAVLDTRTSKPAFSFSRGIAVSSLDTKADFVLYDILAENGSPLGLYFYSINYDTSFSLLGDFQSLDSAEAYFDSLSNVPDVRFLDSAMPLAPNQVWVVTSHDKKYAKILILDSEQHSSDETVYSKVKFKWSFQKNGTRVFDN